MKKLKLLLVEAEQLESTVIARAAEATVIIAAYNEIIQTLKAQREEDKEDIAENGHVAGQVTPLLILLCFLFVNTLTTQYIQEPLHLRQCKSMVLRSCLKGVLDKADDSDTPGSAWRGHLTKHIPVPREGRQLPDKPTLTGAWQKYKEFDIVKNMERFLFFIYTVHFIEQCPFYYNQCQYL